MAFKKGELGILINEVSYLTTRHRALSVTCQAQLSANCMAYQSGQLLCLHSEIRAFKPPKKQIHRIGGLCVFCLQASSITNLSNNLSYYQVKNLGRISEKKIKIQNHIYEKSLLYPNKILFLFLFLLIYTEIYPCRLCNPRRNCV